MKTINEHIRTRNAKNIEEYPNSTLTELPQKDEHAPRNIKRPKIVTYFNVSKKDPFGISTTDSKNHRQLGPTPIPETVHKDNSTRTATQNRKIE